MGSPSTKVQNAGGVGVGKNCIFFRLVENSPAQTPYFRKFVSIRHGCPHPWRCAGGGICGVIISGGSQNLMITVTVQLTWTR